MSFPDFDNDTRVDNDEIQIENMNDHNQNQSDFGFMVNQGTNDNFFDAQQNQNWNQNVPTGDSYGNFAIVIYLLLIIYLLILG